MSDFEAKNGQTDKDGQPDIGTADGLFADSIATGTPITTKSRKWYKRTCPGCGTEFLTDRANNIYCPTGKEACRKRVKRALDKVQADERRELQAELMVNNCFGKVGEMIDDINERYRQQGTTAPDR